MKKILTVLIILISGSVQAKSLNFFRLQLPNEKSVQLVQRVKGMANMGTSLAPIRYADVVIRIIRHDLNKMPNGGLVFTESELCHSKVKLPVYDYVNAPDGDTPAFNDIFKLVCLDKARNNPVIIRAGGLLATLEESVEDANKKDFIKGFMSIVGIADASAGTWFDEMLTQASATRDLNQKSFIAYLSPSDIKFSCSTDSSGQSTCSSPTPIYYSSVISAQD